MKTKGNQPSEASHAASDSAHEAAQAAFVLRTKALYKGTEKSQKQTKGPRKTNANQIKSRKPPKPPSNVPPNPLKPRPSSEQKLSTKGTQQFHKRPKGPGHI